MDKGLGLEVEQPNQHINKHDLSWSKLNKVQFKLNSFIKSKSNPQIILFYSRLTWFFFSSSCDPSLNPFGSNSPICILINGMAKENEAHQRTKLVQDGFWWVGSINPASPKGQHGIKISAVGPIRWCQQKIWLGLYQIKN